MKSDKINCGVFVEKVVINRKKNILTKLKCEIEKI